MSGQAPNAMRFMPSSSIAFALYSVRDNILFARAFVDGLTYDQFQDSRLCFYAEIEALQGRS